VTAQTPDTPFRLDVANAFLAHMGVLYSERLPRSPFVLLDCSRLSREVVRMPLEGQHLGHYRLLRLLGSGGMGEVYLAEDARIGQQVAIKVIRSEGIAYPGSESAREAARLFEREAKAIARLDHPNILPLYAYGEETLNEQQLTYLVMPYRKEGTLASWLRQRGSTESLSPAQVAPLVQQAAEALQHAHHQQVIHQDIKPTNFLIRLRSDRPDQPDLLLADFGIAKLTSATASASQSIRGTPTYMAPEQWEGHPVAATDQYALAVMVYELLVGRPPFQGNPGQVMRQHYMMSPPVPSTLNPRLSPAIDAVLLRALAKQPDERFASVTAFAQAFQLAAQGTAAARTPPPLAAAPASPSARDLRAVLAISPAEAQTGTSRTLTLPGGRQVSVPVPAGVRDGQIVRLEDQDEASPAGGTGALILTIQIIGAEAPASLSTTSATVTEETLLTDEPTALATSAPTVSNTGQQPARSTGRSDLGSPTDLDISATELATPTSRTLPPTLVARSATPPPFAGRPAIGTAKPATGNTTRRLVLIGLAGLIVLAMVGGIAWLTLHRASPSGVIHASPAGVVTEFPVPTPQSDPDAITAGPGRNLWFTELSSNKIGRISPTGSITEFPIPTPRSQPDEITAGPDGNLWFTETTFESNKIGRISPTGSITEFPVPTPRSLPFEITDGHDGNLWFTENFGNKIGRISTSGSITEFPIPTPRSAPRGITAGPDGNLWFTEDQANKIGRISPSGSITEFPIPTPKSDPGLITAGPDGNLWFTEQSGNKIGRISTSGSITEFPIPTPLSDPFGPFGIAAGPDGNLWFLEGYTSNKIGRISPDGSITEFPIPSPQSESVRITAGPDGNLWFAEAQGNKIGRITTGK
jgi:serine/threonine protein kinase/streptogramin lyase